MAPKAHLYENLEGQSLVKQKPEPGQLLKICPLYGFVCGWITGMDLLAPQEPHQTLLPVRPSANSPLKEEKL